MSEISYRKYLKIGLHILLWVVVVFIFPWLFNLLNKFTDYKSLLITSFMLLVVFYLNYYILIPHYLSKKRFKTYAGALVIVLVIVYTISYFDRPEPPHFDHDKRPFPAANSKDIKDDWPEKKPFFINFGIIILGTISLAVSASIRGTKEWFNNEKQLKEIENQKLTAELSFLKAQINPHFFFNTLNGIYALASHKSDQTPEVILKLSNLMRYVIYEANTSKVLLSREINHIENYIDLQKIRLNEMVNVSFAITGNPGILQIEPLLFSEFLENAFKHGIDYRQTGKIEIELNIGEKDLTFTVKNPLTNTPKDKNKSNSGVGLKNIRQRLRLVYPKSHKLTISKNERQHIVTLYLDLDTNDAID